MENGYVSTFQSRFLAERGCIQPSGDPLYSYRMTRVEYDELRNGLREFLGAMLKYSSLGQIVAAKTWLAGLFVLYSAEWWRREYDGSGWSWEPILESLGTCSAHWSPNQRSWCVEEGLRSWRISLSDARGFRFLGSVALQGGLPTRMLAESQGNISWVLSKVLDLSAETRVGESEIEEWIRSLAAYLPHTYRQAEIFRLLTQMACAVLTLKHSARLTSAEGAIAKLDASDPEWRKRFPLEIEDEKVGGLLEQLVKKAATVRGARAEVLASVERTLESCGSEWKLRSNVILPDQVKPSVLQETFHLDEATQLPRMLTLRCIKRDGFTAEIGAHRMPGRENYKLGRPVLQFEGEQAMSEHLLCLSFLDGTAKTTVLPKGDAIESELPWLFNAAEGGAAKLVRQGGGAVSSSRGLIAIPRGWTVEQVGEGELEAAGAAFGLGRTVWWFKGTLRVCDAQGVAFSCRSGQATAEDECFGWSGQRVNGVEFLSPASAWRGTPKLCRISQEGGAQSVTGSVAWRSAGQPSLSPIGLYGPVQAAWPANGVVQWRSRIVLIGSGTAMTVEGGATPNSGTLHFPGWHLASVSTETTGVEITNEAVGEDLAVSFRYEGVGSPPEWCEAMLAWRGNPNRAKVRIPFPAWGVRFFDARGALLAADAVASIEKLHGIRMVAYLKRSEQAFLRLTLVEEGRHTDVHVITLATLENSSRIEIRPIDHVSKIRRMLSNAAHLDAFVQVEMEIGNAQGCRMRVARYSCEFTRDVAARTVWLDGDTTRSLNAARLAELGAMAIQLDAPGNEPLVLERYDEEGLVGWRVPVESLQPGPWLIYPVANSPLLFRPMLWTIRCGSAMEVARDGGTGGEAEPGVLSGGAALANHSEPKELAQCGRLLTTIKIRDEADRNRALEAVVEAMAVDFEACDWLPLEQLTAQLYHLPFSALDVWRVFACSTAGLAALALRGHRFPLNFLERFSNEMPAVWEMVPLSAWVKSMRAHVAFEGKQSILATDLASRVQSISAILPSLRVMLEVAQTICLGKDTPDVHFAKSAPQDFFKNLLFVGERSPYQVLLRESASADLRWLNDLQNEITKARGSVLGKFLQVNEAPFRETVINLPILLAASAATGEVMQWERTPSARTLRQYQDFCADWFREAFDLTVARCVAAGVIEGL